MSIRISSEKAIIRLRITDGGNGGMCVVMDCLSDSELFDRIFQLTCYLYREEERYAVLYHANKALGHRCQTFRFG